MTVQDYSIVRDAIDVPPITCLPFESIDIPALMYGRGMMAVSLILSVETMVTFFL